MNSKKIYALELGDFDLEFDIDLDASLDETRVFAVNASDEFVFAVGSVWVRHGSSRHLISGEFNSGNLSEWFKRAARVLLQAPPLPADLYGVAGPHVCQWFVRYWDRVGAETADENDEAIYDRLFPYCLLAENNGRIVVISISGLTIVQVCAQEATVTHPICFEGRLQGSQVASRVESLGASVGGDILSRSRRH